MSKTLKLADDLALPLSAVTEKLAWLGRTGSGKSYGAMKLAELMLGAGAQIGVLDPVGVWRALRVPARDGGTAFEVAVFGGLYGDVPLEPTAGELVADLVVDRGLSFVLDVSQFIPSEQQTFARAFAHRFFHRKKSAPSAVHLFLEECQEFIPENPSGREALTLGEFQRLWKLGRNFGIGGSLISQRPQEIAKKALNMSGTLFAFQMTGPQERKAIRAWVADQGIATDIESVLQRLAVGQPHVESPTFLGVSKTIRILPRVTADLSSTPEVGKTTAARRPLTPIDVEQLRAQMSATIERAKADDPRELRKLLAQKDKQIKHLARVTSGLSSSNEEAKQEVERPVLTEADRELIRGLAGDFRTFSEDIAAKADAVLGAMADRAKAAIDAAAAEWTRNLENRRELFAKRVELARVQRVLDKLERVTPAGGRLTPSVAETRPLNRPVSVQRTVDPGRVRQVNASAGPAGSAIEQLGTSGAYRMLCALAWHAPEPMSLSKLALRTGIARKGGTFRTYLGKLKTLGWAAGNGHGIAITPEGRAALGDDVPQAPTGADLIAYWQQELGDSGARRMFDAVVAAYPRALSTAELEAATGIAASGGTFRTYLGKLRTLELVTRGAIRASEELFT